VAAASGTDRGYVLMDLVTCGSVDGEAGRVGVNSRLTNGQVILMHEWPANTLTAIPQIAQVLASHNLCPGMI